MSEIKDDPREVLVLLNSLGFVGITATQLKAFMKDLKIYRKIKEREKQQRREEMKAKIIIKQQAMIKESRRCRNTECSSNNVAPSESSNSYDESLVKVKIRRIPKEKAAQDQRHSKAIVIKSDEKVTTIKYHKDDITQADEPDRIYYGRNHPNAKSYPDIRRSKSESGQNIPKSSVTKDNHLVEGCKLNAERERRVRSVISVPEYRAKEPVVSDDTVKPRSRSVASDPIENIRTQSALSTRSAANSAHKSFIRPWRLQPDAQRNVINKKCDPVALYQKYQQEWKQISFPGEAKHSKVRWAVREKMLGVDPRPVPLSRKSTSMPILKKK